MKDRVTSSGEREKAVAIILAYIGSIFPILYSFHTLT